MSCGHVTYYGVIVYQTEGPKYSLMPPLRISARFDTSVRYDCTFVPKNSCMRSKSSVPLLNSLYLLYVATGRHTVREADSTSMLAGVRYYFTLRMTVGHEDRWVWRYYLILLLDCL